MANTIIKTKTFGCICGYNQDFDPYDQTERHQRLFPNVPIGDCPSCATHPVAEHRQSRKMALVLEPERLSTSTVSSDASLESQQTEELDAHGNYIMVESGEYTERLGIVNGKPAVVQEPVMVPKMRSLTTQEMAELKQQRDRNLDQLESIAVKEV